MKRRYPLTARQCVILFEHIDRELPVIINRDRYMTTRQLIDRELLLPFPKNRPRRTRLSAKGRETVCQLLAEHAELLLQRSYDEEAPPSPQVRETLDALKMLRLMRSTPEAAKSGRFSPNPGRGAAE